MKPTTTTGLVLLTLLAAGSLWLINAQTSPPLAARMLVRGAGTTMLEGGTGQPDYVPVLTRIAFHAELVNGAVEGAFECLAQAPSNASGLASADFATNVMYVTGKVSSASMEADAIRISGGSECTGIGAGSNVPFSALIRKGGPGTTLVLTAGAPPQVFKEILLEGSFDIAEQRSVGILAQWLAPLFRSAAPARW